MRAIDPRTKRSELWAVVMLVCFLALAGFTFAVDGTGARPASQGDAGEPFTDELRPAGPLVVAEKAGSLLEKSSAAPTAAEDRIDQIEKTLQEIRKKSSDAESRSYDNKMMARELIRLVKWVVVLLILIAGAFPITILILSRRRAPAPSTVSQELAATLLEVEERQAKLADLFKQIQGEIDYLHSMSVPDLQKLIEQAQKYLQQNEKDLGRASVTKAEARPEAPKS